MIALFRASSRRRAANSRLLAAIGLRGMLAACLAVFLLGGASEAWADSAGPVLVVRLGAADDGVAFTREQLAELGLHRIETETPWTDAVTVFEGPLLRDVLAKAKVAGGRIEAVALNDYRVEIPASDARDLNVILAMRVNGKVISVRERGPLWVIYPWGSDDGLRTELYYSRAIWQLRELIVKP